MENEELALRTLYLHHDPTQLPDPTISAQRLCIRQNTAALGSLGFFRGKNLVRFLQSQTPQSLIKAAELI